MHSNLKSAEWFYILSSFDQTRRGLTLIYFIERTTEDWRGTRISATTTYFCSNILYVVGAFGELLGNQKYLECLLRESVHQFQKDVDRLEGI